AGSWVSENGRIGLAHRRLSIIHLSRAAAQPMAFEEGRYRITYNGEIYNFLEIRQALEVKGHVFKTRSDTEVLLHLYHRYGEKMVDHLRGMYAFALWDEAKKGLLLARDSFGIKPVYYSDTGGTVSHRQLRPLRPEEKPDLEPAQPGKLGFFYLDMSLNHIRFLTTSTVFLPGQLFGLMRLAQDSRKSFLMS
ncbi:MAG: asparagine synthetase B family protein, partial [Rhodospirillales bacterium]